MLQNSTSPAISGCNLGGRPWALAFFSLSQKGKVVHIADFMQWFDEGFTMVALASFDRPRNRAAVLASAGRRRFLKF
jgi:hypothetical protein